MHFHRKPNPRITILLAALLVSAILLCGNTRSAFGQSLLGENVTMGHYLPDDSTIFDGPFNVTVVAGNSDRILISPFADHHKGYGVDIEADHITIDFIDAVAFTAGPSFHGLVINNLVTSGTASITETAPHRIFSYDGSTLKLDWQGIAVPNGATYVITFLPVPEPGIISLLAAGSATLLCAIFRRHRR